MPTIDEMLSENYARKPTSDTRDLLYALKEVSTAASGGASGAIGSKGYVGSMPAQAGVTTTASDLIAASGTPRLFSVMNNGISSIWLGIGATPVKDGGAEGSDTGTGYGIKVPPGGLYESPVPLKEVVRAIARTGTVNVTVMLDTPIA